MLRAPGDGAGRIRSRQNGGDRILPGAGIGRRLLAATIEGARALGARRLYLETNSKLATAIHLYESLGFRHVPPERVTPSPYARSNVQMELHLPEPL